MSAEVFPWYRVAFAQRPRGQRFQPLADQDRHDLTSADLERFVRGHRHAAASITGDVYLRR